MRLHLLAALALCFTIASSFGQRGKPVAKSTKPAKTTTTFDICVYGGTASGVMAAVAAARLGKSVVLLEPTRHVGGLTTGGLGYTDIGNKYAVTGLALDFYRRLGTHYGQFESWTFEPSVAERMLLTYLKDAKVAVRYNRRLMERAGVRKIGNIITAIVIEHLGDAEDQAPPETIHAKKYLDCTYEGDLMAQAGVRYTVGREANATYGETYNGVQLRGSHQFPDGIDPYKTHGDPSTGLLWGISADTLPAQGSGDAKVQAYNFRLCLTDDSLNRLPITKPIGYDPSRYELLARVMAAKRTTSLSNFLKVDRMPNHKTDINNNGSFSTDMIGANYDYPNAGYAKREAIVSEHQKYVQGLLWFLGNDPRVNDTLRLKMRAFGYPKDEYIDNGHFSPQLYVREARRMVGAYVMTQANCQGKTVADDGIGLAAYTMDSHNCRRLVIHKNGKAMVKNEGDVQIGGFGPYPISYRALLPKANECANLLVPVCLSASHIAYGSIRMEPVFMVLGQAAALAAAMAIDGKKSLHSVDAQALRTRLAQDPLLNGSAPDVVLDDADTAHVRPSAGWHAAKAKGIYGQGALEQDSGAAAANVTYAPMLPKTGAYKVYVYQPKDAPAVQAVVMVSGKPTALLALKNTGESGQATGGWIDAGAYNLPAGKGAQVLLQQAPGAKAPIADAVLWKMED